MFVVGYAGELDAYQHRFLSGEFLGMGHGIDPLFPGYKRPVLCILHDMRTKIRKKSYGDLENKLILLYWWKILRSYFGCHEIIRKEFAMGDKSPKSNKKQDEQKKNKLEHEKQKKQKAIDDNKRAAVPPVKKK